MFETTSISLFCHDQITNGRLETTTVGLFCHDQITDVSSKQRHVVMIAKGVHPY